MIKQCFFTLLLFSQAIQSCNNCWGYNGRLLRRQALEHVPCDCNCAQQYHVRYDDRKGYGCIRCGHKLTPTNPLVTQEHSTSTQTKLAKPIKKQKRAVTYSSKRKNKKQS